MNKRPGLIIFSTVNSVISYSINDTFKNNVVCKLWRESPRFGIWCKIHNNVINNNFHNQIKHSALNVFKS